jgi:aminomethyltransferase
MIAFGGWEMPLHYTGILEEHRAVRGGAGLFDVSHMGEVELRGPGAAALCQYLTTNDVERLRDGHAQYTLLCNDQGGVIDDLIVYRLHAERFLLCVNAANAARDLDWIRERGVGRAEILDRSSELALLALQGPGAVDVLAPVTEAPIRSLPPFGCVETRVAGQEAIVARTGYTGGDGFEIFVAAAAAVRLWDALLARDGPVVPVGLGARDTLRLEAGLLLHGADMDAGTSALEAGLGWIVKLDCGPFIGRDALASQAKAGVRRRLAGLLLQERGVPRHDYTVSRGGTRVGTVTSGGISPMLGKGIALAYMERPHDGLGTTVEIDIRGRAVAAKVVRRPFFRG